MPGYVAQTNASSSTKWSMYDISSLPCALESVEEVESDSGSDSGPLSDRASPMGMRRKNSFIFLEMGEKKVIIKQSRWQILLAPIVLIENLTMVAHACTTKVKHIVNRVRD